MRASFLVVACLVAFAEPAFAESPGGGLHYAPIEPLATTCTCAPTHGTCNSDCTITCDASFADCNGDVSDGCEASLADPASCGTCGNDCTQCNENAVCNAGVCGGRARPDRSACRLFGGCPSAACLTGTCVCIDGVDMAQPPVIGPQPDMAHGHDLPGDCSFTGGGTATASMILLVGAVVLLQRRRRPGA